MSILSLLKSIYKKLAKEFHTDLNPNIPKEKFQKLQEDYQECLQLLDNLTYSITTNISLYESILGATRYISSFDRKRRIRLTIPQGMLNNDIIRYKNVELENNLMSSLEVKIKIDLPPNYEILNKKLIYNMRLPKWKLYFGGEYTFYGPDQTRLRVNIPPKTKSESYFKIQNDGFFDKLTKTRDFLYIRII